jgi:hypothetical protein
MIETGRRFELIGRAAQAGRWELAEFQVHELEEIFEELPHARPPEDADASDLDSLASAFAAVQIPDLERALASRDLEQLTAAFGRTAAACNSCHGSHGRGFIEVPSDPGASVPRLDSVP